MLPAARLLAGSVAGLVVPVACAGCDVPGAAVCGRCRRLLLGCPLRERLLPDGAPVVAASSWGPVARSCVLAAKERGRGDVGEVLGAALARAVAAVAWQEHRRRPGLLLVPPPASLRSVARRRARPTRELAESAARQLRRAGAEARAVDALVRVRAVRDQAGLTAAARSANLAGGLRVRRPGAGLWPPDCDTVVVDDVVTTGATATECVRALQAGGHRVLGVAAVALVGATGPPAGAPGRHAAAHLAATGWLPSVRA